MTEQEPDFDSAAEEVSCLERVGMNVGLVIGARLGLSLVNSPELRSLMMEKPACGLSLGFLSLTLPPVLGMFIGIKTAFLIEDKLLSHQG